MVAPKTGTSPLGFSGLIIGATIGLSSVGDSADRTPRPRAHIHADDHAGNEVSRSAATVGFLGDNNEFKKPAEKTSPPKSTPPISLAISWPAWLIAFFAMFRKKTETTTSHARPAQKPQVATPADIRRRQSSQRISAIRNEGVPAPAGTRRPSRVTAPGAAEGGVLSLTELMAQERTAQLTRKNGGNAVTILNRTEDLTEDNLRLQISDKGSSLYVIVQCENGSRELRLSDAGSHNNMALASEKILARGTMTHENLATTISLAGIYHVGKK